MSTDSKEKPITTWPWRALGPVPPAKKPMSLKMKASIQAPLMALVGWVMFHYFGHRFVPYMVWTLSVVVLIGGWIVPPVFKAMERFGAWIAHWVILALNYGLLVPFFYLCFVPGRLVLKLKGVDPMDRAFPSDKPSFWIPRKPVADMAQYKKQH